MQLDIFSERDKQERIDKSTDSIRNRWGYTSIKRAVSLTEQGSIINEKIIK